MIVRIKDVGAQYVKDFARLLDGPNACEWLMAASADCGAKAVDVEKRTLRFVASDDSVDADGEVIAKGAFHESIDQYMRNPILLASHRTQLADGWPAIIGSVKSLATDRMPVIGVAEFDDHPRANAYWGLYVKGHQRGFSMGFRDAFFERRDRKPTLVKARVVETSTAVAPVNPNSLSLSYLAGKCQDLAELSMDGGLAGELRAVVTELRAALVTKGQDTDDEVKPFFDEEIAECLRGAA